MKTCEYCLKAPKTIHILSGGMDYVRASCEDHYNKVRRLIYFDNGRAVILEYKLAGAFSYGR